MTPDELVRTASPAIGHVGGAPWYFDPQTIEAGKAVGLDGLRFYFLGRGGTLGDVDWRIVSSAFGYFNPATVEHMFTTAKQRCAVDVAVRAHLGACADYGRRVLPDVDEATLQGFCEAGTAVVAGAIADPAALVLFAGYAAQPVPDDLLGRTMHLTAVLRELRGSVHLAAVAAAGLRSPVAHAIRRPNDVEMFGWKPGDLPDPTDDDRRRLTASDTATDEVMARLFGVLDEAGRDALAAGATALDRTVSGSH